MEPAWDPLPAGWSLAQNWPAGKALVATRNPMPYYSAGEVEGAASAAPTT